VTGRFQGENDHWNSAETERSDSEQQCEKLEICRKGTWSSCWTYTVDIQVPEFQTKVIFNISLPDLVFCAADCSQCAMAVSLSYVDTLYLMLLCLLWILLSSTKSVTSVCSGYYLSPWWSLLLAVNPVPCTVVVGVCVGHCLLCAVEVICFGCGPSNQHHGSVYCLNVEPCTVYLGSHL
jgi:hypothetical protein